MSGVHELSDEALSHVQAFKRFYMWAGPLHDAGHIIIAKNSANLDRIIAKRFRVAGQEKTPAMEVTMAEMAWISRMPWASAGINIGSSRLYLFAKPAEPLKQFAVTIPIEDTDKLDYFKESEWLDFFITGESLRGNPAPARIKLAVVNGNKSPKKKNKR